ncbi:peptide chain release factor 1 [Aestuariispira insulae]|uniref:Uncharacterized protein n=1 Tax=Aestuariispira insulae TaxID=1461337 RepID=A0A3D9H8E9_9PROT|nr:peptide chain release factor 1 [Aestuariispira insulae]RED45755.1 hypothetical protein DFP90_1112 [Aestuariispira insulae]
MSTDRINETFVETLSAVNCANGVVRLFFVGQDLEKLASGEQDETTPPEIRQCVTMPLPGFLYAVSVMRNFLEDEKLQALLQQYQDAGLLPPVEDQQAAE